MGEWAERGRALDYFHSQSVHCATCGKTIPRRAWVVEEQQRELVFCHPDCERIYRDYWLPRYGSEQQ
jgi:ribosomal protein S26